MLVQQQRTTTGWVQEQHLPEQASHLHWAKGQHGMWRLGTEHVHMAGGKGHKHTVFQRWDSSLLCFPSLIKGWNKPLESTVCPGEIKRPGCSPTHISPFLQQTNNRPSRMLYIALEKKNIKWSIDKLRLIFTKMFISSAYALPLGHYGNVRGLIGSCE